MSSSSDDQFWNTIDQKPQLPQIQPKTRLTIHQIRHSIDTQNIPLLINPDPPPDYQKLKQKLQQTRLATAEKIRKAKIEARNQMKDQCDQRLRDLKQHFENQLQKLQ